VSWTDDFPGVLDAARRSEPWAFEAMYRGLAPAVRRYLRAAADDEVDDLTQEVFIGVARGVQRFQGGEDDFRSWVFSIAHHRLVDHHRRRRRQPPLLDPARGDVESEAVARLGDQAAQRLVAGLPPDQAEVVLLRVVGDLSVEEVARIVGKRPGAVRALQHRALRRLRRDLGDRA